MVPGSLHFAVLFCAKGKQFFASLKSADDEAVASSAGGLPRWHVRRQPLGEEFAE